MKFTTQLRIPAHLWEYGMTPSETVFLAYLYELKLSHLRGENNFVVESYSAREIVDDAPGVCVTMSKFYRMRKTLIQKRLLVRTIFTGIWNYELNPNEFKRWHDVVEKKSLELFDKLN